ncbi:amino acid adenylation domain-containing protein [Kitasatospora sp. A2-31]|uniref:amino acid adenylation domain-containing protein n=1 Tax=Kitasatospora sp. A2-31 TaxID=2916414 RepID=UPI001EEC8415|nr:amino acid adenylation domain-containing protein [Kitasatospora sp. A2-31]MCG6495247.1 amino acid adenylation domain-containing protein [Kitasatospora sp. A2-31]
MATGVRYRVAIPAGPGRLQIAQARACHSLTARARLPITPEAVRDHARKGAADHPVLDSLRIWHETVPAACDEPAAQARTRAEAERPLQPGGSLRAVLLTYTDGVCDLVLVGRRTELTGQELHELAALLLDGERFVRRPRAAAATRPSADRTARPAPEWGLGEPSRAGRTGSMPVKLGHRNPSDALLVGATAFVLARHSSLESTAVGIISAADTTEELSVCAAPLDEQQTVRDYLAQYRGPFGAEPTGPTEVPVVGVVFDDDLPDTHYRPFLAPPLPIVVHWRRAADGGVQGTLHYDEGDLATEIASDFAAHLRHVADQMADGPDRLLGDIDLMPHAEALRAVENGRTPAVGTPEATDRTIHGLLAEIVRSRPEAVALADGDEELSYAQLDQRAEQMARGLLALGISPGSLVAVALDRTAELVVTLLGVLKAGCAYVPMDIRYPNDRLRYTVGNTGTTTVIGDAASLPEFDGVRVVSPAELTALAQDNPALPLPQEEDGSSAAYVIYTSGSTGRPKGVVVPHRNVAALVTATRDDFGLGPADVWTFFHSYAFDFSVWEIWGCLLTGGRIVVVPYWVTRDTELFYELVADQRVTVLNQTPSAFAQFIEADGRLGGELALRLVVFGGEPLDVGMLAPWFARHSPSRCRLSNMFGITETTVHVTEQTLSPADVRVRSRSVGRAMPGWSLSVRDPRGRVLPAGAPGEIYVGGAGVARGYLHQPELTAERFVLDPYGSGRLYRTGDLGRIRPDGRLDHLGRIDSQVKIRGHRIELDEIRNVLLSHPSVSGAAVVLRCATPGDSATARIDAYVALRAGSVASAADLLTHASGVLPDYMMPATVTVMESIPLTINGKVDTAALPEPTLREESTSAPGRAPAGRSDAPSDPLDGEILALWSEVLNTEVGPGDNFFEHGGNSLLVIRLLREMRDRGLPRVSTQDFYRNSVAMQFIQHVRGVRG